MLFHVTRTSIWGENKPHDKCIPIKLTRVDSRTFRTPEEYDERLGKRDGKWLSFGTNHRIEDGRIVRDFGVADVWCIEINSLEELMSFKKDVDEELVIGVSYIDEKTPYIEIYDAYRE